MLDAELHQVPDNFGLAKKGIDLRTEVGRALRTLAGAGPPDGSHLGQGLGDDVPGR